LRSHLFPLNVGDSLIIRYSLAIDARLETKAPLISTLATGLKPACNKPFSSFLLLFI